MADEGQLKILRRGIAEWNAWREQRGAGWDTWREQSGAAGWNTWRKSHRGQPQSIDLTGADLTGAELYGANLIGAELYGAKLIGAELIGACLTGADLTGADLTGARLIQAELTYARLFETDLTGANLMEASLFEADLTGADLTDARLFKTDLTGADLTDAKLFKTDLRRAGLVMADLDGANLTGAKLWETQRWEWSIRNIICWSAFWDREGKEATEYGEGEFERIHAERPRIVLRYPGGVSAIDLLALPLIVERLQAEHPDCALQVRSVQNDAGGASVTITVEDLKNLGAEAFAAEVEALHGDLLTIQHRLSSEERLRLKIEGAYRAMVGDVLPLLLEKTVPKQEINIGHLTAPMAIEGPTMSRGDTYIIPGQAGAVGPGARAERNTFQQIQSGSSIDLPRLVEELGRLREAMKREATGTREQDKAIGAVADAEEAAAKGDGSAAVQYLKSAGKWTLGIAEKIGVALATEALKKAM